MQFGQREAERVFEIPAVMNTIFVDDPPIAEAGSKAMSDYKHLFEWCLKEQMAMWSARFYSMSKAAAKGNLYTAGMS